MIRKAALTLAMDKDGQKVFQRFLMDVGLPKKSVKRMS